LSYRHRCRRPRVANSRPGCPRCPFNVLPAALPAVRRPGGAWSRRQSRPAPPRRRKGPGHSERAAEQAGRDDGHALGVQAAALDVGAVDAHRRGGTGAEQLADQLCLPADHLQGPLKGVVVVPGQPVRALVDTAGPLLAVNHEHAGGTDHQVVDVGGRPWHGEVVEHHVAAAGEPLQQAGGAPLPGGDQRHSPDKRAGPGDQLMGTAPSGGGQG
jgi:hypothetical protein